MDLNLIIKIHAKVLSLVKEIKKYIIIKKKYWGEKLVKNWKKIKDQNPVFVLYKQKNLINYYAKIKIF